MNLENSRTRVSLLAIPEVMASTLMGIYDLLNSLPLLASFDGVQSSGAAFDVEIVGPSAGPIETASGVPVPALRAFTQVRRTDVIIVPSVLLQGGEWQCGRYPALVRWLLQMHRQSVQLCSTCSGVLLLAETGLLDGKDATIHWIYASTFRRNFPAVHLRPDKALIAHGERGGFLMSGASTSWHDLVLYLIAQRAGPTTAQTVAKLFAIQSHTDGLSPYLVFEPATDHGDAAIGKIQEWLGDYFSVANPVEQAVRRSGMAERSFKRRFKNATGYAPISYVQRLRIEEAKRRLERTAAPVDEIGWAVGYEDSAFFRRLFKRLTGVTAGAYRRKFQIPGVGRG